MPSMICSLCLSVLALAGAGGDQAGRERSDEFFRETFEGTPATINQIRLFAPVGSLGTITLEFDRTAAGWSMRFMRGREIQRFELPGFDLQPGATRLFFDSENFSVVIPHGPTQPRCFVNGSTVRGNLVLGFLRGRFASASVSSFSNCQHAVREVEPAVGRGVLTLTGPDRTSGPRPR
jgi:hypothetical protein